MLQSGPLLRIKSRLELHCQSLQKICQKLKPSWTIFITSLMISIFHDNSTTNEISNNVFLPLIKNQNGTYFNFEQMISSLTSKKCWTFDSFLLIYANCFTAKRKGNFSTTKILTKNYILIRRRGGKYAGKMAFPIYCAC